MEFCNAAVRNADRSYSNPAQVIDSTIQDNEETAAEKLCGCRDGFLLTAALRAAQQAPDVRQNKIEALKARVAAGEYEVDARALAMALVRDDAIFCA